jgi:small-conductance mechanosensitive channel
VILHRIGNLLLLGLLVAFVPPSMAAGDSGGSALDENNPDAEIATAPVTIDGNVLLRVRGVSSLPAEQRAVTIAKRIEALAEDPQFRTDSLGIVEAGNYVRIMGGSHLLVSIVPADAQLEQVSMATLARAHLDRIRQAIEEYRHSRESGFLLRHAFYALGATGILMLAGTLLVWLARRVGVLIERRVRNRIRSLEIQSFQIMRAEHIWSTLRGSLSAMWLLAALVLVLTYLHFTLSLFPWTRGAANHLFEFVVRPLKSIGYAILDNIPNLIFLAILFYVVRFVVRLVRLFFEAVSAGSVKLQGFDPDWSWPTYKITRFAIVAFAVIVAYPYIPGSESAAFKGVSLFLGVVVSLGSSSAISNLIAGYLMTYRRAFKSGDRVKIGDVVGDVIEMRLQATHLRTIKNEEVVVPNSVILNSQVVNYTSLARHHGLILHTTVGIGYETPWRQVEAMLLLAAGRTQGLLKEPAPFILQTGLANFAIDYELNVYCSDPHAMQELYSALHRSILDVFNEYGVQIMTPAYRADTPQPKVVPKEQWHAAPARQEDTRL